MESIYIDNLGIFLGGGIRNRYGKGNLVLHFYIVLFGFSCYNNPVLFLWYGKCQN